MLLASSFKAPRVREREREERRVNVEPLATPFNAAAAALLLFALLMLLLYLAGFLALFSARVCVYVRASVCMDRVF